MGIVLYPLIVGLLLPTIIVHKYDEFECIRNLRTCYFVTVIIFISLILLPLDIIMAITPGIGLSSLVWDFIDY